MTTEEKRQRVIDMVRKLRAHAEGGRTIEEQAAFAGKVLQLMDDYHISEAEVTGADERGDFVGSSTWESTDRKWSTYELTTYVPMMAMIVARPHGCRIVVVEGKAKVHFVGEETDRAVAIFMFDYLLRAGLRLANSAANDRRKSGTPSTSTRFKQDFLHGWMCCLSQRYDEMRAKETPESMTSVIRMSEALTRADRFLATCDEFSVDGMAKASSHCDDDDAAIAGVEAAIDVSLATNGITGSTDVHEGGRIASTMSRRLIGGAA